MKWYICFVNCVHEGVSWWRCLLQGSRDFLCHCFLLYYCNSSSSACLWLLCRAVTQHVSVIGLCGCGVGSACLWLLCRAVTQHVSVIGLCGCGVSSTCLWLLCRAVTQHVSVIGLCGCGVPLLPCKVGHEGEWWRQREGGITFLVTGLIFATAFIKRY